MYLWILLEDQSYLMFHRVTVNMVISCIKPILIEMLKKGTFYSQNDYYKIELPLIL